MTERQQNIGKGKQEIEELGIPKMPDVQELAQDSENTLKATMEQLTQRGQSLFEVNYQEAIRGERRLAALDGHLVYYKENEPQTVGMDLLLIGVIAGGTTVEISNPEKLEADGLDVYNTVKKRIQDEYIDLTIADKGNTIDLSELDNDLRTSDRIEGIEIIEDELAKVAENRPQIIRWLGHKKMTADGRNLRTDLLKVSLDESGTPLVELNPHKRLSVVNAENVYEIKPRGGSGIAELIQKQKDGDRTLTDEDKRLIREYQTAESGFRKVVQVEMHRPFTEITFDPIEKDYLAELDQSLIDHPKAFEEPLDTIILEGQIEQVRKLTVTSGTWVMADESIRESLLSPDNFLQVLSLYSPEDAKTILRTVTAQSQYYISAKIPDFEWGIQGPASRKKRESEEKVTSIVEGERKTKLAEAVGIPDSVLPSSVLGVAMTLGLVDQGKVYTVSEKERHPEGATVIYGTTDFANPAELIMLANAASVEGKNTRGMYFADSKAHSVGSYMERILLPSLVSMYRIDDTTAQELYDRAKQFEGDLDISLEQLKELMQSVELNHYVTSLQDHVETVDSFSQLYASLNIMLAQRLGVEYFDANEVLSQSGLTIADMNRRIEEISVVATQEHEEVKARLLEKGLPEARAQSMIETMFGKNGSWAQDSRRFLRTITGNEETVDQTSLDEQTPLSQLADQGITLGGNAWVVAMQSIDFGGPTVIAHKNTGLGGNYTTPVLESDTTKICLSPIVRVIPNGHSALRGDGLDIGAYILHPSLITTVSETLTMTDPKLVGGQSKAVVEFSNHGIWVKGEKQYVRKVTTALEASNGGRREVKSIALVE